MNKLKINSDVLISVLDPLQAVINPNHIVPILQCVMIDIQKEQIQVTGDNHEVRCTNSELQLCETEFAFCVNFQLLTSALRSLKNQEIEIKVDKHKMTIIHKQGDFEIPLEDALIFPKGKEERLKLKAELSVESFKKTLKIANKFVVNEELVPMSNLSIEIGKKTTIRSTNRISLFQETIKGGGDSAQLLISGKTSTSIYTLMENEDGDVKMKYNETAILFKFGRKEVVVIQQTGKFPVEMFNKIIQTIDDSNLVEMNKEKFLTAIKRVSTLSAKEKIQTVKLIVEKDNINLSCDNIGSSSRVQENLSIKTDIEVVVGFNSKLLVEVLSVFDKGAEFGIGANNMFCINEKKRKGLIAPVLLSN